MLNTIKCITKRKTKRDIKTLGGFYLKSIVYLHEAQNR